MKKIITGIVLCWLVVYSASLMAAKPVFIITATQRAPAIIFPGQTATASYTITNNVPMTLSSIALLSLPAGVSQTGGSCGLLFNLSAGASCSVDLQIVADALQGSVTDGPIVCSTLANPVYCSRPAQADLLNVVKGTNPSPPPSPPVQPLHFVTIGYYSDGARYLPSSYISIDNGQSWTVSATMPPAQSGANNSLASIVCDSTGIKCAGAGVYDDGFGGALPLSDTSSDGGNTWQASLTPPPAQAAFNFLNGIACDRNVMICTAVGSYNNGGPNIPLSYTSGDGGVSWQVSSILPPAQGGGQNYLQSVACDSTGMKCASVGVYDNGGPSLPLSYTSVDGGNSWQVSSTLPPVQGIGANVLNSITCDSTGMKCTAVGQYINGGPSIPLSYTSSDGGDTWQVSSTLPPVQGNGESKLFSVACDSTRMICTAVGYYKNNALYASLSYTSQDGGATWQVSTTLPPAQGSDDELSGVSCDSSGLICVAVGTNYDSQGVPLSFTSSDGGITWIPSTIMPSVLSPFDNNLTAVSGSH